ncbi:PREDICTED: activating transcription factor 7-interacting protein 1 isoform X1 [Cyprinodon variegatus]|uniref:Activating transcription factor 7 interacting protein n=2 Tax=Cyprinodon variegatus TaxID=28743 RepID=A0A3Q2C626_CYPVA|nr:PREDICTED: activating transcription factor 7-interacting protein 1 isoform X1 [Cyprinodon variegatus]
MVKFHFSTGSESQNCWRTNQLRINRSVKEPSGREPRKKEAMEVVVTEEKKKIFRAKKTMKISDRLQLESLHSTLLNTAPGLSNPSPPPLVNGTHKEDGQKMGDKEHNSASDPSSPQAASPTTPGSLSSPAPFLSLNLSPSPGSSDSPSPIEEAMSKLSPPPTESLDSQKMEDEEKKGSSPSPHNESVGPVSADSKEDGDVIPMDGIQEKKAAPEEPVVDLEKDSDKRSPEPSAMSECIEPMDADNDSTHTIDSEDSTSTVKQEKPPKSRDATASAEEKRPIEEEDLKEEDDQRASAEKESNLKDKMKVDSVKVEPKKEKREAGETKGPTRPSSTPPCNTDQGQKSSASGLKRTLSEGNENDAPSVKREGKRPKVEHEELEAQLELKITAKAGSQEKLEKIVQQLVNEHLKILELTNFNKNFQELKNRVDKIECATKHQTAIHSLQSKIARMAKKFGEANQMSENKRKQEALAVAAAAASASAAAKTATVANSQTQRPVRTSVEVKQTPATVASSSTAVVPVAAPVPASTASPASSSAPSSTSATTIVPQGSILQLITSSSNAASTLATAITTQSQTGTLVLKTTPGSGMVAAGQPLVIQLPLSMNGQTGTLVNFPVSSLAAATSLNKAKTTPTTTTFILKPSPAANTAPAPTSTAATLPTLQASSGQVAPTQISLARAVYQGGAGRITTPNAGVSVTTVRAPAQSVSVAGAVSSASSPATSGPAATGSTAPGTPQGTSLTSKTDNQASAATPSKAAAPPPPSRPKGSVIDLTEDDDDVQVTGVKNASGATPSAAPRSNQVISIPSTAGTRSSPKANQNSASNPQITVHHRPPQESSSKPRTVTTTTPSRSSSTALPPLPIAPVPQRLPPEAEQTSPPQQLQLKLVPGQSGIVLSWSVAETDRSCATVDSYHLYAFHQDNSSSGTAQQHWKKIGEVNALPLPMACTLTQFQSGSTYYFAVRAKDIYGRFGSFCEPQCTNVISSSSS